MDEEVAVMIQLCGDGFRALVRVPGEWMWTAIGEKNNELLEIHGKSQLEAIQDLWISLSDVEDGAK